MFEENRKISIILPVYNAEKYLKGCLEHLCAQTLKDVEIIVVNDGSTDKSPEILSEYASKDKTYYHYQSGSSRSGNSSK